MEQNGGKMLRLNNFILTNVKVKSINDVSIPNRASNKFRVDAIRLGHFYIFNVTHNEILETIFSRQSLHYDELILEGEVESSDDESECNESYFPYDITVSAL